MADFKRARMVSQSSSSSSDSSCLDPSETYARMDVESRQDLLPRKGGGPGSLKGEKSSGRLAVASLALSALSLALVGGGLLWVYLSGCSWNQAGGPGVSGQGRVCMPCGQVSPNPFVDSASPLMRALDVQVDKDDRDTPVCCASTPAQYAALFKLILQRQEEVKKLAEIMSSDDDDDDNDDGRDDKDVRGKRSVSAHLVAKPNSQATTANDPAQTVQRWKSPQESPVSHVRGLRFRNDTLHVRTSGLYFVYCQILFNRATGRRGGSGGGDEAEPATLLASHYVRRHSLLRPASSGLLLKARHTRVGGQDDRHSSYAGGLFFLHPGDRLYVQVSVPELVSHDDRASFFGLFRVGD